MKCQKCQFENIESAKFCGSCGAKILRTCPRCGSDNEPGNNFCIERLEEQFSILAYHFTKSEHKGKAKDYFEKAVAMFRHMNMAWDADRARRLITDLSATL